MLRLEIDLGEDLAELEAQLMASVPQINRAIDRALKKTARWLETHSKRELGAALQMPQRVFKTRFFRSFFTKDGKRSVNVWFGLAPIRLIDISKSIRKTADGVAIGKYDYQGAFVATMKSGHKGVFERTGEGGHKKRSDGQWSELPIREIGVDIEHLAKPIVERYHVRAEARFKQILKQEINFALNVEAV